MNGKTSPSTHNLEKRREYRNAKIIDGANGQQCQIESPVCTGHWKGDVVAHHSNRGEDGKGFAQKADDCYVAYGCQACGDWYDGRQWNKPAAYRQWPQEERQEYFDRGMRRTWRLILDLGILK